MNNQNKIDNNVYDLLHFWPYNFTAHFKSKGKLHFYLGIMILRFQTFLRRGKDVLSILYIKLI
jgi:hypothetical protein